MSNPFPFPPSASTALLRFFLDRASDACASAGCNDMDQSVFSGLGPQERMDLYAGFLKWDEQANPEDDWEPRKFESISDSAWLGYLVHRMGAE